MKPAAAGLNQQGSNELYNIELAKAGMDG